MLRIIILFMFWGLIFLCSCRDNSDNRLTISPSSKSEIKIDLNDSVYYLVTLKQNGFRSINRYTNDILDGEQLVFGELGKLEAKYTVKMGISSGHQYHFFESGSLKNYTYYKGIYPTYFGVQYWDNPLNTINESIHYGDRGRIDRIKFFDSLGYPIKDSIPPNGN